MLLVGAVALGEEALGKRRRWLLPSGVWVTVVVSEGVRGMAAVTVGTLVRHDHGLWKIVDLLFHSRVVKWTATWRAAMPCSRRCPG